MHYDDLYEWFVYALFACPQLLEVEALHALIKEVLTKGGYVMTLHRSQTIYPHEVRAIDAHHNSHSRARCRFSMRCVKKRKSKRCRSSERWCSIWARRRWRALRITKWRARLPCTQPSSCWSCAAIRQASSRPSCRCCWPPPAYVSRRLARLANRIVLRA
jgi:hypothetical protein